VPQTVGDCFDLIERSMFKGPWVLGETYTIADPYLFTVAQWWEDDRVDPARFPRLEEHRRRVGARPAVQKAIAIESA
jgi:glutathione S-transferase